jgi:hypothetical protein
MARTRKGSPHQAKHFQPEDHAHSAHQEEATRGRAQKPDRSVKGSGRSDARKTSHPMELTPKSPRKGQ